MATYLVTITHSAGLVGDSSRIYSSSAESRGAAIAGSSTRTQTKRDADASSVVGGESVFGLVTQARGSAVLASEMTTQSRSKVRGSARVGSETTVGTRFLIPLRLRATRVTSDVGFMWIPVYLQLPERADLSYPWEFFYDTFDPTGTAIPHLIRNLRSGQVRAMVYMRPMVNSPQSFFCRVG